MQRNLAGYSPWDLKELGTAIWLSTQIHTIPYMHIYTQQFTYSFRASEDLKVHLLNLNSVQISVTLSGWIKLDESPTLCVHGT